MISGRCTGQSVGNVTFLFLFCTGLKTDIFVVSASLAEVERCFAEWLLENCLEPLMICVYCNVVFPIKVLVPLFHVRDNGKIFLFILSAILLGVVQLVRCETDRLMVLQ